MSERRQSWKRGGQAGLHAQDITIAEGLAEEPGFSVITPSHGGRRHAWHWR